MEMKKRVYLDFAAATPLLPEAKAAMEPFMGDIFANPSSVHKEGVVAKKAVEEAREEIARALSVKPQMVTFTGGGTEANNLALLGVVEQARKKGLSYQEMEIITTKIEHSSISRVVEYLQSVGVVVRYVSVDDEGRVSIDSLREFLNEKTILVSVSYVNSEIGVTQPLHQIKKQIREAEDKFNKQIYFHVDAAQAPLWLSCQFDALGADLLMLDMGKCCGPKGVGVLVRSQRVKISPVLYGGGQEAGLRSGTENVVGIVGAGVALRVAQEGWGARAERAHQLRNKTISYVLKTIPEAVINGPLGDKRVANNINISISGLDTEYAMIVLDSKGFAVSTKSACAGAGGGESVVVKTISGDATRARSTLRFTFGPDAMFEELKDCIDVLKEHIEMVK